MFGRPETEVRTYTPIAGELRQNSVFTPVLPAQSDRWGSSYSVISSGMMTPTRAQQSSTRPEPLQSHASELPPPCGDARRVCGQLSATAPIHEPAAVSYSHPDAQRYHSPQVIPHTLYSHGPPQYATLPSLIPPPQQTLSVPRDNSYSAYQMHLPSGQTVTTYSPGLPHRSAYGVPTPKIPDFSIDSEKEFANLKLAIDNLLEPHSELQALQLQYGQPHQLAQSEIAAIRTTSNVKPGDAHTFQSFALRVHLLVSMLLSLEGPKGMELNCCSHVDRLLSKLPKYHRDGFIEYLQMQGKLNSTSINPNNLQDLNGWLQGKAQQQRLSNRLVQRYQTGQPQVIGREKIIPKKVKVPLYITVQGPLRRVLLITSHNPRNHSRYNVSSVTAKNIISVAVAVSLSSLQLIWTSG